MSVGKKKMVALSPWSFLVASTSFCLTSLWCWTCLGRASNGVPPVALSNAEAVQDWAHSSCLQLHLYSEISFDSLLNNLNSLSSRTTVKLLDGAPWTDPLFCLSSWISIWSWSPFFCQQFPAKLQSWVSSVSMLAIGLMTSTSAGLIDVQGKKHDVKAEGKLWKIGRTWLKSCVKYMAYCCTIHRVKWAVDREPQKLELLHDFWFHFFHKNGRSWNFYRKTQESDLF